MNALIALICAAGVFAVLIWIMTPARVSSSDKTESALDGDFDEDRDDFVREEEPTRTEKLEELFRRQREIDVHSPAARALEQRAIDAEFAQLCPPAPTRRSEA